MNMVYQYPIIVKHERMSIEFVKLHERMRAIVIYASHFMEKRFSYQPIWTEFWRSQDQQNTYYTDKIAQGMYVMCGEKKCYSIDLKVPTVSVHQLHRGSDMSRTVLKMTGDFGLYDMTDNEIEEITENVNEVFPYGKIPYKTCIFHEQYGRPHFHFQSAI